MVWNRCARKGAGENRMNPSFIPPSLRRRRLLRSRPDRHPQNVGWPGCEGPGTLAGKPSYLFREKRQYRRSEKFTKEDFMINVTSFGGENWLITPAASAVHETPPATISNQRWLLVLSGVALVNLQGLSGDWHHDQVAISPDMNSPLDSAISRFSIPRPHGSEGADYSTGFQVDQWAPVVGLGSVFDAHEAVNAGFAVDTWRPAPFGTGTDAFSGQPVGNIFTGVVVDAGASDSDAWLYRLGYNFILEGRIVFTAIPRIG
jgi:hypothetical protein